MGMKRLFEQITGCGVVVVVRARSLSGEVALVSVAAKDRLCMKGGGGPRRGLGREVKRASFAGRWLDSW